MESSVFDPTRYVHQLKSGRWIVAYFDERDGRWYAPMTPEERRLTGCHTYYAGSLESLGCTSYVSRKAAMDRARKLYGPEF
jgi:hypothetical protein